MKKAIKGLIVASAVAAVVGVGAVSYAAWSGSTSDVQVTGSTGAIKTIGAITVTPQSASLDEDSNLKALVPADQGNVTDCVNYWILKLDAPNATDNAEPTYQVKATLTKGSNGTNVTGAALYWLASAPNATTPETTNAIGTDFATITPDSNGLVYVYMVATGTAAMKADITLTFNVAAE